MNIRRPVRIGSFFFRLCPYGIQYERGPLHLLSIFPGRKKADVAAGVSIIVRFAAGRAIIDVNDALLWVGVWKIALLSILLLAGRMWLSVLVHVAVSTAVPMSRPKARWRSLLTSRSSVNDHNVPICRGVD